MTLLNTSNASCTVDGYPTIALLDNKGSVVPFTYQHGGGEVVTPRPPRSVTIAPGHVAYVTIDKNGCVLAIKVVPVRLELSIPGQVSTFAVAQPFASQAALGYCGPGDPAGDTIFVSPFEPTLRATLRLSG